MLVLVAVVFGWRYWVITDQTNDRMTAVTAPVPEEVASSPTSEPAVTAPATTAPPASSSSQPVATTVPPTPVVMSIDPTHLFIPSIGVNTTMAPKPTELQWNEFLKQRVPMFGVPDDLYTTTWWSEVKPGERGPDGELPVILGHTQVGGGYGVFNDLGTLQAGADVALEDDGGNVMRFQVISVVAGVDKYDPNALRQVLQNAPTTADLVIMTCSGTFNGDYHASEENTVVFAEQVPANG